ncbi:MAG: hypothetical protein J6Y85_04320 [Alphaproteobacteria bacterium]|nr:hypothetical protein [Alphaproteobacteria bacterium]
MKKNIFVLAFSLTFATAAHAETTIDWTQAGCESVGGTWITAHSATDEGCDAAHCNGMHFCRSPNYMNWFSALTWCKGIGRNLVDFYHICPGVSPETHTNAGACANAYGIDTQQVWTTLPSSGTEVFHVQLQAGTLNGNAVRTSSASGKGSRTFALCE